jgi:hypothetical protein
MIIISPRGRQIGIKMSVFSDDNLFNVASISNYINGIVSNEIFDRIFRILNKKQHSQATFLKQVKAEGLLKYNTLEKVQMVAKYKESTKTKKREFFIELCKTNLSHDSIDTKIRDILRESGIQEVTVCDVKNVFEYVVANNGLVNIYKAEKQGLEKQVFEYLIENELLCVEGDIENLYCLINSYL